MNPGVQSSISKWPLEQNARNDDCSKSTKDKCKNLKNGRTVLKMATTDTSTDYDDI